MFKISIRIFKYNLLINIDSDPENNNEGVL